MPACSPSITLTQFSPLHSLLYHLWKAFDINFNVGGACGEIVALNEKYGVNLLNPLVTAQNFEYKMSNIFNKPLESTSPNSQWCMISTTVGRTAARCLECYQKLLDETEGKELGLAGSSDGTTGPSADDVRKLRPGEIDPVEFHKPVSRREVNEPRL